MRGERWCKKGRGVAIEREEGGSAMMMEEGSDAV